jgi:RNA polymerase subunit RPABC4/transcription elongation factor Spt4
MVGESKDVWLSNVTETVFLAHALPGSLQREGCENMNILQAQQQEKKWARVHLYTGKRLAALTLASVISVLVSAGDFHFQSSLGWFSGPLAIVSITIYLLVIATILMADWHGFLTMNGSIKWRSMSDARMILVGCVFVVCNVFFLGYYLVRAYQKYRNDKRLEPLRQKRKKAQLEAGLGMIPPTEGVCHRCHRPLQLGAEFCSYCRASVTERPRICPACYATAQPDAIWCPLCGAQLGGTK